ncbi:hypothetical protein [Streptomyces sp. NBC_01615]|uniref:hypothetical protein n=1 Tax=Streptomyces sp. NBC_01615 TaxID=2975898 RepID=UPI003863413D
MKRTALVASALSLAALTGLTGCGSGDDTATDTADKPKASASQAKQVSPAEGLTKLVVTKTDVDGYEVEKPTADENLTFAKSQDEVTVDRAVCAPLAYAMNQLPLGDSQADLTRVASKNNLTTAYTYITLATYTDGKAESAMADLSKAVSSCGSGFTAKANGNSSPYDSVTAETADKAGDESLAFKSTMTFRGVTHTLHSAAVRYDDVIAVYFSVNGSAIAESRPSDAKLPTAVVEAQNSKLG